MVFLVTSDGKAECFRVEKNKDVQEIVNKAGEKLKTLPMSSPGANGKHPGLEKNTTYPFQQ